MSMKYLEVFLNDSLSWDTHLNILIPKLDRAIDSQSRGPVFKTTGWLQG